MVMATEKILTCMDAYQRAEAGAAEGDGQRFSFAYPWYINMSLNKFEEGI